MSRARCLAGLLIGLPIAARAEGPSWLEPRVPSGGEKIEGAGDGSAAGCGACHVEIAREWRASTHAWASLEPQFLAERAKDPAVGWLCDNCHTPLAAQQVLLSTAGVDVRKPARLANPSYSASLRDEGVTCLTCHARPGAIAGVHAGTKAPHPVVVDRRLRSADTCTPCHQAVARVDATLVCAFDTGEEWRASGVKDACPACHMPRVERPVAAGFPSRDGGRHTFGGSGLPKFPGAAVARSPAGARISLVMPTNAKRGAPGSELLVGVRVDHDGAGHRVPTGDPERFLLVIVEAVEHSGRVLGRATHRVGQTWRWAPTAEKLADNRLSPGEMRVVALRVKWPPGKEGILIRARLEHHRMSKENAAFHGLGDYPLMRVVQRELLALP